MKKATQAELPAVLVSLLGAIIDRELAARLSEVMAAAGRCIERLAGINLVALEPKDSGEGSADLALWEKYGARGRRDGGGGQRAVRGDPGQLSPFTQPGEPVW